VHDDIIRSLQASIIKANVDILGRVSGDYNIDFDEMINRYGLATASIDLVVPSQTKKKNASAAAADKVKVACSAINAKKRPCKRMAMPGCAMCKLHAKAAAEAATEEPVEEVFLMEKKRTSPEPEPEPEPELEMQMFETELQLELSDEDEDEFI
jgi:hypothetical protein